MLYGDREDIRNVYFEAWHKHKEKQPLTAIEQSIVALLLEHPEYHKLMENPHDNLEKDFHTRYGDTNPFAHIAAHLMLLEQLQLNRPVGIRDIYQQLLRKLPDEHEVQHQILEVFTPFLWRMLQTGELFNENDYLTELKQQLIADSSV